MINLIMLISEKTLVEYDWNGELVKEVKVPDLMSEPKWWL